jgi:hypothetical protein
MKEKRGEGDIEQGSKGEKENGNKKKQKKRV